MNDKFLSNQDIKATRVVVIDSNGQKLGEFLRKDALQLAEEANLDLVQVSDGERPTCKIIDLGKMLYEHRKKSKLNISKVKTNKLKEIQFGIQTDDNYMDIKAKQAKEWLNEGNRVKVSIQIKGREINHLKLFEEKSLAFHSKLADVSDMEVRPKLAGNKVEMILTTKKTNE
mgnify:CR=1